MKTTERFDRAVTKLYNAFHAGSLNSNDCAMCAVGNICDNKTNWGSAGGFYIDPFPSININFVNSANNIIAKTGYSRIELINVEKIFISAVGLDERQKHKHFKGLCAVVEYLCELDGIPNVMDYTKFFETENNQPKYELAL